MRGAFGKPQGTVARIKIGQIILSVRTKDAHKASAIEAFRRAKFKFPGRQKVSYAECNCVVFIVVWFRSLCPRNGDSPSGTVMSTRRCVKMAD